MKKRYYNWKRYWCPIDKTYNVDPKGFLMDPETKLGNYQNPDIVSFDEINDNHCLVLLGEPGIGKSYTIENERQRLKEKGEKTLLVNLLHVRSREDLRQDLFNSWEFKEWKENNHRLHIFIDGFDECSLPSKTVIREIVNGLKRIDRDNIFLRIVSRKSFWENTSEYLLSSLWNNKDSCKVFELTPLRYKDIENTIIEEGYKDSSSFFHELQKSKVEPFASRPLTFILLLDLFKTHKKLPNTQLELYKEGCIELCRQKNKKTQEENPEPQEMLALAGRLAYITIFCDYGTINYEQSKGQNKGILRIEDLIVEKNVTEKTFGTETAVNESNLKRTLNSGLFNIVSKNQWTWVHRSFAEFLAAQYIIQHKLSTSQINSLIFIETEFGRKVVPQLREVASWITVTKEDIFNEIINDDTLVLLQSSAISDNISHQSKLIDKLFKLTEIDESLRLDLLYSDSITKLKKQYNFSQLAEKLKPKYKIFTRRFAIRLAIEWKANEFQEEILTFALDPEEDYSVRKDSTIYINKVGDKAAKKRLKPLAEGILGEDPDNELKGIALESLWPELINIEELFTMLTFSRKGSFFGFYRSFINIRLPKYFGSNNVRKNEIIVGLRWICELFNHLNISRFIDYLGWFDDLYDSIVLGSLKFIDDKTVVKFLSKIIIKRFENYQSPLEEHDHNLELSRFLEINENARRDILSTIIYIIDYSVRNLREFSIYNIQIVRKNDIEWMIERVLDEQSENIQKKWASLIKEIQDFNDLETLSRVYNSCQKNQILKQVFAEHFEPVDLDSEEAERLRTLYKNRIDFINKMKQMDKEENSNYSFEELIIEPLELVEKGDVDKWWYVDNNLQVINNKDSEKTDKSDITTFSGWICSDEQTRIRFIKAMKKYVIEFLPDNKEWVKIWMESRYPFHLLAGYRALRYFLLEDPKFIDSLDDSVWKKWTPTIIVFPEVFKETEEKYQEELFSKAYEFAPEEFVSTLMLVIDKENSKHDHSFVIRKIESILDTNLSKHLIDKVKEDVIKPGTLQDVLVPLLQNRYTGARELAESLLANYNSTDELLYSKAISAASTLVLFTEDASWDILWPLFISNDNFAREVIQRIVTNRMMEEGIVSLFYKLTESQLVDLFFWIYERFPPEQDPLRESGVAYSVTYRDEIVSFRHNILSHLVNRGTREAINGLYRVLDKVKEKQPIKNIIKGAMKNFFTNEWKKQFRLKPSELIQLAYNNEKRIIRNGDDLQKIVINSLERLQYKLKGEALNAQFLWNEDRKGNKIESLNPKDENILSDFVKLHFDYDLKGTGIIINREVRIRPGQFTDIHIDIYNSDTDEIVKLIVEVKCCWNSELNKNMKLQLVDKYLKNNCENGIYLVGYFDSNKWNGKDYKKSKCTIGYDNLKTKMEKQAKKLSQELYNIKAFVLDITYNI